MPAAALGPPAALLAGEPVAGPPPPGQTSRPRSPGAAAQGGAGAGPQAHWGEDTSSGARAMLRKSASSPALRELPARAPPRAAANPAGGAAAGAAAAAPAAALPRQRGASAGGAPWREARGMEVYVVSRAFTEFGGPLFRDMPPDVKRSLVDLGICHYMTVFKTRDGRFHQFDFGPRGGDVEKAVGPLAGLLRAARAQQQQQQQQQQPRARQPSASDGGGWGGWGNGWGGGGARSGQSAPALELSAALAMAGAGGGFGGGGGGGLSGDELALERSLELPRANGEIRERVLEALPASHMYVGRTNLSIDDVRLYNLGRAKQYRLHDNDCRHYVNQLVQYATGMERSTQHLKRHHFRSRHAGGRPWHGWLVEAGQVATDVGNWSRLQAGGAATLLAVTGRVTLAHLKALAAIAHAKGVAAGSGLLPQPASLGLGPGGGAPPLLPPLAPLLRSAQLHISNALAAAAAAGAPGGAAAAAAAGAGGGFGGFGVFASLLAPTGVVAAGLRRPLASSAAALGAAGGPDGAAAALAAAGGGGGRGALVRVREQLGRGLSGAAQALHRLASGPSVWAAPRAATPRPPPRRAAAPAPVPLPGAPAGAAGLARRFGWLGGSAARMSGALASVARKRAPPAAPPPPRGASGAGALAAAAAGCAGGSACSAGGCSSAGGPPLEALDSLLFEHGGDGAVRIVSMRKSASCGALLDAAGSVHFCSPGGRQTLRLPPTPRLSWLRREAAGAIVLRGP